MLKKTKKGYYVLEKFAHQKYLIHGFSTRRFGNMSVKNSLDENKNLNKFLNLFGQSSDDLIMMEQVHGNRIKSVSSNEKGKVISSIDGAVCNQPGITLGVKVADCLPILFFDHKRKIIGIVHAGWKGILKRISQSMVKKMKSLGCQPNNILVGIGPHIGPCCYTVSKIISGKFKEEFGDLKNMITEKDGEISLNLAIPTIVQLIEVGVLRDNVEIAPKCTSCQNEEFFSYRTRRTDMEKRILGFIGMI